MAEQPKSDWKERELGALWTKESSKDGSKFLTGEVVVNGETIKIIVYKNKDKGDNEKAPSMRIYRDRPFQKTESKKEAPKQVEEDDDIPI